MRAPRLLALACAAAATLAADRAGAAEPAADTAARAPAAARPADPQGAAGPAKEVEPRPASWPTATERPRVSAGVLIRAAKRGQRDRKGEEQRPAASGTVESIEIDWYAPSGTP